MRTASETSILREVPIFSELTDQEIDTIMQMANRRVFNKNTMILLEEAAAETLFIIEYGSVKITRLNDVKSLASILKKWANGSAIIKLIIMIIQPIAEKIKRAVPTTSFSDL